MAILNLETEKDFIEKETKASGKTALCEMIWNSLDADASEIYVKFEKNHAGLTSISVEDNGHGIIYEDAKEVFRRLGGSLKAINKYSPGGRKYHGKLGKGRIKSFSLGFMLSFRSYFSTNSHIETFKIIHDYHDIKKPIIDDSTTKVENRSTGFIVRIDNLRDENCKVLEKPKVKDEIAIEFAPYYFQQHFLLNFDGTPISFEKLIKRKFNDIFKIELPSGEQLEFHLKIFEWHREVSKKLYICGNSWVSLLEQNLEIRSKGDHITAYLYSEYFQNLQENGDLDINMSNYIVVSAIEAVKEKAKEYLTDKVHKDAIEFIENLKRENLYPFKSEPKNKIEKVSRQAFDIVAFNINKHLPSYDKNNYESKKLMFELIKESLEEKPENLKRILLEVLKLPKSQIGEFNELLDKITLSDVIGTASIITNRIKIIDGIRRIFDDKKTREEMLERKHFQKIIENETWLFGDDYTHGVSKDQKLYNVLKMHLSILEREDFVGEINEEIKSNLEDIPDLCLFKSYNLGKANKFENLIIELKRPSATLNIDHFSQIERYAIKVSSEKSFDKNDTQWTFFLLGKKMNEDLETKCNQRDREFGHFSFGNVNIYVKLWDRVLDEAEARHRFIIERLNFKIDKQDEGIAYIKNKYSDIFKDIDRRKEEKILKIKETISA